MAGRASVRCSRLALCLFGDQQPWFDVLLCLAGESRLTRISASRTGSISVQEAFRGCKTPNAHAYAVRGVRQRIAAIRRADERLMGTEREAS